MIYIWIDKIVFIDSKNFIEVHNVLHGIFIVAYNVNKRISWCNKNKYHTTTSIDILSFIRSSIQNKDKINIDCKYISHFIKKVESYFVVLDVYFINIDFGKNKMCWHRMMKRLTLVLTVKYMDKWILNKHTFIQYVTQHLHIRWGKKNKKFLCYIENLIIVDSWI